MSLSARKIKKAHLSKWRPSFIDLVRKTFRRHSRQIAENVIKNNALFSRLFKGAP